MHRSNSEAYNNFTVQDGGSFSFTRTGTDSDYGLSFEGALTVGNGGTFIIKSTSSRAALYLNASAASASFVEPAFVQLYNASGPIMGFSSSGRPLSISADTVNMWQGRATDTDSINNMPTAIWNKADTATPVTISLSYTSGGAPTGIVNSDLGTLDPVIEGVAANMNMNSARQITMGKFTLNGPIKTSGASGNTEPNADMYMAYGSPSTRVTGVADGAGAYLLEPPGGGTIALNEEVIVLSHKGMLKARNRKLAELDPTRTVRFEQVPSIMSFGTVNIGAVEQTIPRVDPAWSIQIYDGRGAGSAWRVQAAITGPLSSGSDTLPNALVYMNGGIVTPFSATEQLIYNGVTAGNHSTPGAYTDISWPPTDGPMLIVGPGQGMVGQTYQTTLVWTLYDAP